MKIKVKDLLPNSFRDFKNYPVDRVKVETLKESIQDNEFWDNLICRKKGKKYELAYGHHRLIALQELKIDEVDIPVKDIDDFTMIRIMADENIEFSRSPAIINETVKAVKIHLDQIFNECKEWEELSKVAEMKGVFESEIQFKRNKKDGGVGNIAITRFLNNGRTSGRWNERIIQKSLGLLIAVGDIKGNGKSYCARPDGKPYLDRKAAELFESLEDANSFRSAAFLNNTPIEEQMEMAKEIKFGKNKTDGGRTRDIIKKVFQKKYPKEEDKYQELFDNLTELNNKINGVANSMIRTIVKFDKLKIEEIQGIENYLTQSSLNSLLKNIRDLAGYLGYNYKHLMLS